MRLRFFSLATVLLFAVTVACSGDDSLDAPEPAETQARPDEIALIKGPLSEDGIQAIFATSDLAIGKHRVGFVLQSEQSLVRAPAATVKSRFFAEGDSEGQVRETALAVFRPWPYGTRGIYTTLLTFDAAGRWRIDISISDQDGSRRSAQLSFDVAETTEAPDVGSPAILSANKTVGDVEKLSQLTTGSLQDSDLYQLTIADAAMNGLPTVVVMASPAFCTNAVCGPQVEVLQELKDKYKGQANFIHVDFYDNPEEIQGDLDRARLSPTVLEWRLPSTEWSFIIDRNRNIAARFESFATFEELEQALQRVL
ncbi:MAG: hypothetical protein IH956_00820 [Chloroflexi bacterium]|nr:hypothetical protein [Chloroflexota bacterium]